MSLRTKLKLFNCIILSVHLYGCESLKVLREIEERVKRFESVCLRTIMKIRGYDIVSEEELRHRSGQQNVIEKLKINRRRWYGHVQRMSDKKMPKQAVRWKPAGRTKDGRLKDTWQRTIQWNMTVKALNPSDVKA